MSRLEGEYSVYRQGRAVGTVTVTQDGLMTVFECVCEYKGGEVLRLSGVSGDKYVSLGIPAPDGSTLRLRKSMSKSALEKLAIDFEFGFFLTSRDETPPQRVTSDHDTESAATPDAEPDATPDTELQTETSVEPAAEPEQQTESITKPEPIPEPTTEAVTKPVPELPAIRNGGHIIPKPENTYKLPKVPPADDRTIPDPPEPVNSDSTAELLKLGWLQIDDPSQLFSDKDIQDTCRNAKGTWTKESEGYKLLAIPVSSDSPFPMMPIFCFGKSEFMAGKEYIVFKTKNGSLAL